MITKLYHEPPQPRAQAAVAAYREAARLRPSFHDIHSYLALAAPRRTAGGSRGAAAVMAGMDLYFPLTATLLILPARPGLGGLATCPRLALDDRRTDFPWYAAMRLYRQARRVDLAEDFARVGGHRIALARARAAASA